MRKMLCAFKPAFFSGCSPPGRVKGGKETYCKYGGQHKQEVAELYVNRECIY